FDLNFRHNSDPGLRSGQAAKRHRFRENKNHEETKKTKKIEDLGSKIENCLTRNGAIFDPRSSILDPRPSTLDPRSSSSSSFLRGVIFADEWIELIAFILGYCF